MEISQILVLVLAVTGVLSLMIPVLKKVAAATKTQKDDAALEAVEKGLVLLRSLLEVLALNARSEGGVSPAAVKKKLRVSTAQIKAKALSGELNKFIRKLEGRSN